MPLGLTAAKLNLGPAIAQVTHETCRCIDGAEGIDVDVPNFPAICVDEEYAALLSGGEDAGVWFDDGDSPIASWMTRVRMTRQKLCREAVHGRDNDGSRTGQLL